MAFQTFEKDGLRLRYQATGRGDPLILIHGLSGSARWWRYNIPVLALHHRVYVVELVGYGSARRQRAVGITRDVQLLSSWLAFLELHNVTLIGHSMGGHVALRLAQRQPARVKNLVLVCASGLLRGHIVRLALRLPAAGLRGRRSFLPCILADSARAGWPNLWRSGRAVLQDDVAPHLAGLKVRTLVVWGGLDPLIPVELGRVLASAIPGAKYHEIPQAGHVAMVDAPREFNRVVLRFLRVSSQSQREAEVTSSVSLSDCSEVSIT